MGFIACAILGMSLSAHADLFGDDQARQAILDLRKRVDQIVISQNKLVDENASLRRSFFDLMQQIETLKTSLSQERGRNEELAQQLSMAQKQISDLQQQLSNLQASAPAGAASATQYGSQYGSTSTLLQSRDNSTGPSSGISSDYTSSGSSSSSSSGPPGLPPPIYGVNPPPTQSTPSTPAAKPASEQHEFDAALTQFKAGNFTTAQTGFANFVKHYPRSPQALSALFWLGNAQYATRNYKEAISNFKSLLSVAPQHDKAPESLLSIANCQIELKDQKAARATLQQLITAYPNSEAASAAKERLASLKKNN